MPTFLELQHPSPLWLLDLTPPTHPLGLGPVWEKDCKHDRKLSAMVGGSGGQGQGEVWTPLQLCGGGVITAAVP